MSNEQNSENLAVPSRRLFLKQASAVAIVGGSAALLSGAMSRTASAAGTPHTSEYKAANAKGPGGQRLFFEQIQTHENDHVAFLETALGSAKRPKPTFKDLEQKNFAGFVELARALENTGVGAYLGAAPVINSAAYLAAAGSILTIESRHSGYINTFVKDPITEDAAASASPSFDAPLTAAQVVTNAGPFVASLNGGADLTYSLTPSDANDIDILNFALALEYLEQEFYNLNVPKFYKVKG